MENKWLALSTNTAIDWRVARLLLSYAHSTPLQPTIKLPNKSTSHRRWKLRLYKHKLPVDQRCSALDVLHENAHVNATHVVTLCGKMDENLIVKLLEGHKCVISRRTTILDSLGEIFGLTSVAKNLVNARVGRCHVKVPLWSRWRLPSHWQVGADLARGEGKAKNNFQKKMTTSCSDMQAKEPTQQQYFLGMVNYMGTFIPNMEPLRAMLKKDNGFHWEEQQTQSFQKTKSLIAKANETPLRYYDRTLPVAVQADASLRGLAVADPAAG